MLLKALMIFITMRMNSLITKFYESFFKAIDMYEHKE